LSIHEEEEEEEEEKKKIEITGQKYNGLPIFYS